MPGFDRTGPAGQGAMTGRGLGPCGRGLACRRGFGRGFGRGIGYSETVELNADEQKKVLEAELKDIEAEKEQVLKRLKEIKK